MLDRFAQHWVYGGTLAALLLLALAPLLALDGAGLAVYLALPAYMLHQFEEHDADRFRIFINDLMGPGRAGLSVPDVALINIVGVWVVLMGVIWLTARVDPGWGVAAAWFLAVNGVAHVGQAIALRRYNPGLVTAALFFLPLAALEFYLLSGSASLGQHLVGAAAVLGLHAAIVRRAIRPAAGSRP